jgi:copper chaperone CopZ
MRFVIAGLVLASGLALGCTPPAANPTNPPKPAGGPAPSSGTTGAMAPNSNVKFVSMKVPGMHCPSGCFAPVKEALEAVNGIKSVELVKQKATDKIDDPTVHIYLNGSFDSGAALAAVEKAGFKGELN